jgi:hypothetical protein
VYFIINEIEESENEERIMAGYNGYSKSNNAVEAESEGRFPMTAAKKILADEGNVTQKIAAKLLKHFGNREWHHTSKFYNCTDYFDTNAALNALILSRELNRDVLSAAFLGAFFAYGLQGKYDWEEFDYNDAERAERVVEFNADVESGKWAYMIK